MFSPLLLMKIMAYLLVLGISLILIISILSGLSVNNVVVKLLKKLHLKIPNQGNFWKHQPICFEYTNQIESIKGKKMPIDIKDEHKLRTEQYLIKKSRPKDWAITNTKTVSAFLNKHLYYPEEKTLTYYNFINPIFFEVWDYEKLLGTISIQSIKCVLNNVQLVGYYGDHLCTHSKHRRIGITPGMIQLLYYELNTNYVLNDTVKNEFPVIFFRVDNEPLPHGQKYLCQLKYYSKEIEIKNSVEEQEIKKELEIDWDKWYNVHLNKKVTLQTTFDSFDDFKNQFSHSYLKKYQSPDGKVLIMYCESWKNQKIHNKKQKIYEIYEIFIEDDFEKDKMEQKSYIDAFEKWLLSNNDSNFLVISNNCGNKYQWCKIMYEQYNQNEGHDSYLYVFNLNFMREYRPEEIDLYVL